MKKCVMTLMGCALFAGLSVAASVSGNNTAVVIQKAPVQSPGSYFQFLCVPVKGFDITGAGAATVSGEDLGMTISLKDLLPPSEYPAVPGTDINDNEVTNYPYVQLVKYHGADADFVQYNCDGTDWVINAAVTGYPEKNPELNGGDIMWLQSHATTTKPTIFCGELVSGTTDVIAPASGITAQGNKASTAIKINDNTIINGGAKSGDVIYVLQSESNEYKNYLKADDGWKKWAEIEPGYWDWTNVIDDTIPAGEAFYYYRRSN